MHGFIIASNHLSLQQNKNRKVTRNCESKPRHTSLGQIIILETPMGRKNGEKSGKRDGVQESGACLAVCHLFCKGWPMQRENRHSVFSKRFSGLGGGDRWRQRMKKAAYRSVFLELKLSRLIQNKPLFSFAWFTTCIWLLLSIRTALLPLAIHHLGYFTQIHHF